MADVGKPDDLAGDRDWNASGKNPVGRKTAEANEIGHYGGYRHHSRGMALAAAGFCGAATVIELTGQSATSTSSRVSQALGHCWVARAKRPAIRPSQMSRLTEHHTAKAATMADNASVSPSKTGRRVQAIAAELPTASLQELKQRAHQLLLCQRTLQQNEQRLIAERDTLQEQLELLVADCDGLRAERDNLAIQLQQLQDQQESLHQQCERAVEERESAAREALFAALSHVFPYSAYRGQRPDLASLNDQDLMDHFVAHGIHEGAALAFSTLEVELQQLRSSLEDANAKAELMNQKSTHTAAQLDLLKDLFAKMTIQP